MVQSFLLYWRGGRSVDIVRSRTKSHAVCFSDFVYCGIVVGFPGYKCSDPGLIPEDCQSFWEVVGLERGSLSFIGTIQELLEQKCRGSGLEYRDYGHRGSAADYTTPLYPQKLTLTSQTSGGSSNGIVHSRIKPRSSSLLKDLYKFEFVNIRLCKRENLNMRISLLCGKKGTCSFEAFLLFGRMWKECVKLLLIIHC
jgi:hypothetical protein